ncbi:MAG: hypothetical protein ACJASQ_003465 [Crocinitomicaceae bacterium]|jgi:hypothetical protein
MKIRILLFTLFLTASSCLNAQSLDWAQSKGGAGIDRGHSIAVDASGNTYSTGTFSGTTDFDPGAGALNLTSNGFLDIFIQKLDANGNLLWAKSMGGTSIDRGLSIAVDASGNVYTTGSFSETVDFDPGIGVTNLTSSGGDDIFIQKLDSNGDLVWAGSMGSASFGAAGYAITSDASGNIYTTGIFQGTIDFDLGPGLTNLTSNGGDDIFIQKLDASGNLLWAKSMGSAGAGNNDAGLSIITDIFGNVYSTGFFQGTVDFDPGVGTTNLTSIGSLDGFIQKLDINGNFIWAKSIGGTCNDIGYSIAVDAIGNVYSSGEYCGTVDFDPGIGTSNFTSNGIADAFIQKLDVNGDFVWGKSIGGISYDAAMSITLDANGNIYTTGNFESTVDFDPGPGVSNYTSNGFYDIFIQKLDVNGNFLWAGSMGGSDLDFGSSIVVDNGNNIHTTGYFFLTADFDPGVGINNLTSNGSYDIFIQKFSQCEPTYSTDIQTACDSYLWIDGNTYTSDNNVAIHTLTNAAGCDSIVTLDLTVNYSNGSTDVQTACDSYLWIDGVTYTSSNNAATQTFTNAAGCDSIVTLDLTINYSNASTDVQTACDSYLWIDGITYTSSNNAATQTFTNAVGCDSIVTLDLTVSYSNGSTDVQTACDSYLWIDGVTYTSSNNAATQTFTNAVGCDSIVTLDLTINYSNASTDIQTACDSYLWIDGITYTSSNNAATQSFINAAGCDSIVTLDLTINYSNGSTDVQTACGSYLWIDGVTYTSSNSSATQTFTNAAGCDSIVTLDLTINAVNISTTTTGVTITSDAVGVAYQWIDCSDYSEIIGETNQSFTATINGDYAVIVTENGCSDTSTCVVINSIGINENDELNNVVIYPNPNNGIIHLELGSLSDVDIRVFSVQGKLVLEEKMINLPLHQIEFKAPSGVYYLKIQSEGISKTYKLIKNK